MKQLFSVLPGVLSIIAALAFSSCASAPPVSGDGSSLEKAVYIAETEQSASVTAEINWLTSHYPPGSFGKAHNFMQGNRAYSAAPVKQADGSMKDVYFDITSAIKKK